MSEETDPTEEAQEADLASATGGLSAGGEVGSAVGGSTAGVVTAHAPDIGDAIMEQIRTWPGDPPGVAGQTKGWFYNTDGTISVWSEGGSRTLQPGEGYPENLGTQDSDGWTNYMAFGGLLKDEE